MFKDASWFRSIHILYMYVNKTIEKIPVAVWWCVSCLRYFPVGEGCVHWDKSVNGPAGIASADVTEWGCVGVTCISSAVKSLYGLTIWNYKDGYWRSEQKKEIKQ